MEFRAGSNNAREGVGGAHQSAAAGTVAAEQVGVELDGQHAVDLVVQQRPGANFFGGLLDAAEGHQPSVGTS